MSSMFISILLTTTSLRQNTETLSSDMYSTYSPDDNIYSEFDRNSSVALSVFHESFVRSKSNDLKSVSNHTQTSIEEYTCAPANVSYSVRTLFEYDNISILPTHRLKIQQTNLIPAICFYSDSFIPIHQDHLNALEEAKNYITNLGTHELLATYISPSHSEYVAKKVMPEEMIGVGHRLSMISLAIDNLDWVMVDLFQIFQPCDLKLSVVMKTFISRVHSQLSNGTKIDIFWLLNEDSIAVDNQSNGRFESELPSMHVVDHEYYKTLGHANDHLKSVEDYYKNQR